MITTAFTCRAGCKERGVSKNRNAGPVKCNALFGHMRGVHPMRETARKWGKRLLWILLALLAVYCVAQLSDYVWFRTQVPAEFQNANWSGTWQTEQYVDLSGRLLVRLPDPLPENQDFEVQALVYYPIYSVWKTGQFVEMDFKGHYSPDVPESSGRSSNEIPGGGGKLKFKGTTGKQVVEYTALIDPSRTRIVGGYLSSMPNDHGLFVLARH